MVQTVGGLGLARGCKAALVPSMCSHPDGLLDFRGECELVTSAGSAAGLHLARLAGLVVEHQEVVLVPARRVATDERRLHLLVVVFHWYEEDAVI